MCCPPIMPANKKKIAIVKNWLGRKGLHYLESCTEGEKQVCGTLQGLIDTLAEKFRSQYNETIKSLQFIKFCGSEGENAEVWMGRLCIVAAECNFKEIDHQLKELFIHGLNNKSMLDDVIRELTTKNINQQMTSEDVLLWAKRVEVQRVQVAILSDITMSERFYKIKVVKKQAMYPASPNQPCRSSRSGHALRKCQA